MDSKLVTVANSRTEYFLLKKKQNVNVLKARRVVK